MKKQSSYFLLFAECFRVFICKTFIYWLVYNANKIAGVASMKIRITQPSDMRSENQFDFPKETKAQSQCSGSML